MMVWLQADISKIAIVFYRLPMVVRHTLLAGHYDVLRSLLETQKKEKERLN